MPMANVDLVQLRPPRVAMTITLIAYAAHLLHPVTVHPGQAVIAGLAGMAGFLLMLRAWWLFRAAGTAICPTAPSTTLVTHDVFSFTRNPMYLGIVAMIGAGGIATGSLSFYVAAFAFLVFIDRVFCDHEEQKALAEFGDRYRDYTESVRRWL